MYKLLKDEGSNKNITLLNTDTMSSVIIGKLTPELMSVLTGGGITFDEDTKITSDWNMNIDPAFASALSVYALHITKPTIKTKEVKVKNEEVKKPKTNVDAMDVLFGLATYD